MTIATMPSSTYFVLVDLEDEIRLIHDTRYAQNDSRRLVAFVEPAPGGQVEVTWLRSLPLRTRFNEPCEALAEIEAWTELERCGGAATPVPIAHYAPRRTPAAARHRITRR